MLGRGNHQKWGMHIIGGQQVQGSQGKRMPMGQAHIGFLVETTRPLIGKGWLSLVQIAHRTLDPQTQQQQPQLFGEQEQTHLKPTPLSSNNTRRHQQSQTNSGPLDRTKTSHS